MGSQGSVLYTVHIADPADLCSKQEVKAPAGVPQEYGKCFGDLLPEGWVHVATVRSTLTLYFVPVEHAIWNLHPMSGSSFFEQNCVPRTADLQFLPRIASIQSSTYFVYLAHLQSKK